MRETFAAFARGDAAGFKKTLDREMTWHSALVPLLKRVAYHGPDEIWSLLSEEIPAVLEGFSAEVLDVEDLGIRPSPRSASEVPRRPRGFSSSRRCSSSGVTEVERALKCARFAAAPMSPNRRGSSAS